MRPWRARPVPGLAGLVFVLLLVLQNAALAVDLQDCFECEGRTVERVDLVGIRYTQEYVIRRELGTRTGHPLSLEALRQDLQRLDNLDVFSTVRADLTPTEADGIAVTLFLRELPPVVPYISYDVTDQDGWSFGPAVKAVNLLGRDIYLAGYALFGGRTSYFVDLTHPWMFGDHVSLDLDASRIVRDNEFDGFRETSWEFTPRLGTWLGTHGRASVAASWLRFEADLPGHTLSADDQDDLLRLGGSVGWDSRDHWANPHCGWWTEAAAWKTGGALPGDGDFWTLDLDGRRFQPVPTTDHTLVVAGLLTLQSGSVGRDLPEYMDFHLGGANSLRGYSIDDLGGTLYGKQQLLTTLEYRFGLIRSRDVSVFGLHGDVGLGGTFLVDGGLAWTRGQDFAAGRARIGVGAGLRLLIPAVDFTRLEVGYGEAGWTVHFASFSKMRAQRLRLR